MIDVLVLCAVVAQTPQPFPRVGQPKPAPPTTSTAPAPEPQRVLPPAPPAGDTGPAISTEKPSVDVLGVQIYPGAEFLASYDAGHAQRYYLFGTNAAFDDIVSYYRTVLREKGELIYEQPPIQEFDTGKFREDTMAFPPSVTVKDYSTGTTQGYLFVSPGQPVKRFKTIIQVVPASPGG